MSLVLPTIDEFAESARERINNFNDPRQEWRRLVAEFVGTFFLVTAAAGGSMVDTLYPGSVSPGMKAAAIGLTIMAVILFLGKVSGSHLNPAITIAFAARGDFPWRRVPGYIIIQIAAGFAAALMLTALVGVSSSNGGSYPGSETSPLAAMFVEMLLTFGLASVVLGTASGAQSVGMFAALGVGGYIAAAAMWGAPLSGSSMDPARTIGPNIVGGAPGPLWVYIIGPILGGLIAVILAYLLRGRGGHLTASQVAQGALGQGGGGSDTAKSSDTNKPSSAPNSGG
jgi:aquaporin Z